VINIVWPKKLRTESILQTTSFPAPTLFLVPFGKIVERDRSLDLLITETNICSRSRLSTDNNNNQPNPAKTSPLESQMLSTFPSIYSAPFRTTRFPSGARFQAVEFSALRLVYSGNVSVCKQFIPYLEVGIDGSSSAIGVCFLLGLRVQLNLGLNRRCSASPARYAFSPCSSSYVFGYKCAQGEQW
jgi:hypothetical protein